MRELIAYSIKRLPVAVRSYFIPELELCSLAINIASFSHLLKRVDLDTIVDNLALTHIIKNKAEPVTTRIKRLLELIGSFSLNLYYMKGKDMILSSFYQGKHMTIVIHTKSSQYHLTCTNPYMKLITVLKLKKGI